MTVPHSSSSGGSSTLGAAGQKTTVSSTTRTRTFRVSVNRVGLAGPLPGSDQGNSNSNSNSTTASSPSLSRHQRSSSFPLPHRQRGYSLHHFHSLDTYTSSSDGEDDDAVAAGIRRLKVGREIRRGSDRAFPRTTASGSSLDQGQDGDNTRKKSRSTDKSTGTSSSSSSSRLRHSASSSQLRDGLYTPSPSPPSTRQRQSSSRSSKSKGKGRPSMTVPSSPTFGPTSHGAGSSHEEAHSNGYSSRLGTRRPPNEPSDFPTLSPSAYLSKVYASLPKPGPILSNPLPVPSAVPSSIQLVSHRLKTYDLVHLQRALSLSFYVFLSLGAGLALVAILVTSYLLTIADDARSRVHQVASRADRVRTWVASGGGVWDSNSSNRSSFSSTSSSSPNSRSHASSPSPSTPGSPRPERAYPHSQGGDEDGKDKKGWNEFLPLSLSLFFSSISRLFSHLFSRPPSSSSSSRRGSDDTQNPFPRPPLRTLIPSFVLALLIAILGVLQTTSFWRSDPPSKTSSASSGRASYRGEGSTSSSRSRRRHDSTQWR